MRPLTYIVKVKDWDFDRWERDILFRDTPGLLVARQRMTQLTPQYARVEGVKYYWTAYYLTKELGTETSSNF